MSQDQSDRGQLEDQDKQAYTYEQFESQKKEIEKEVQMKKMIGEKCDLKESLDKQFVEYSKQTTSKIAQLYGKYKGLRRVRGDGNCFYRSFLFALFERLREMGDTSVNDHLCKVVKDSYGVLLELGYPSYCVEDFYETFLECFEFLVMKKKVSEVEENNQRVEDDTILDDYFNDQSTSDTLVCFLRFMVSQYLKKHQDEYMPFLMGTIDSECKDIEVMNKDCEMLHMNIVSCLFSVNINIEYLDVTQNQHSVLLEPTKKESFTNNIPINLLFTPGHYEILYKN